MFYVCSGGGESQSFLPTAHRDPEPEGGFTVTVPALPGCVTHGDNVDTARKNARDAIECHLASLLKHGEPIPVDDTISTSILVGGS